MCNITPAQAAVSPTGNTPTAPGASFRDGMGNAVVVSPQPELEENPGGGGAGGGGGPGGVNRIIVNNIIIGGGVIINNIIGGNIILQGGLAPGGAAIRRGRRNHRWHPGRGRRGRFGVKFGPFVPGMQQMVGFGDDNNGFFVGQGKPSDPTNSKPFILVRSDTTGVPIDSFVHSDLWNWDKLDGNGPSNHVFSPENKYEVIIDYNWCGGSAPRVGFQLMNPSAPAGAAGSGEPIWVHGMPYSGAPGDEWIRTPDLPISQENRTFLPSTSTQSMEVFCTSVQDMGGSPVPFGQPRSANRGGTERKIGAGDLQQVIAVQSQPSPYHTTPWKPKSAEVTALNFTDMKPDIAFEWFAYINPEVGGPVAFAPVDDSSLQADTGGEGVVYTPGTTYLLASGVGTGRAVIDLSKMSEANWGPGIDQFGTPDRLVIAARPLMNDGFFYGSINWEEP